MKTKAYIARDKGGNLCIYTGGKPYKCVSFWALEEPGCSGKISNNLFPEVKWEDEDPTEVRIEIVGKKAQQTQPQTKFDPKTLKPFDKVLIRAGRKTTWEPDFFGYFMDRNWAICVGAGNTECIPYNDETKSLVGTTQEAPEYYRYWEE